MASLLCPSTSVPPYTKNNTHDPTHKRTEQVSLNANFRDSPPSGTLCDGRRMSIAGGRRGHACDAAVKELWGCRMPPRSRTRARCAVSTTAIENPRCVLQTEPSVQRVHFACSSSAHRPPRGADLRWPCLVRTGNRLFHRMTIAEAIGGRQRRDRLPQQCSRRCSASAGLCECCGCRSFVRLASVVVPHAGANGACR